MPTDDQKSPGDQPQPASNRAGQAIGDSDELFRLLVDGIADYAIYILDPQGRVTTWNCGAQRIKGYSAEEIIGQHLSVFYASEAIDRGWPQYELEAATRDGRFEDEGWRVRKDGSRFWANVIITALRNGAGVLLGFSKITRDLTESAKQPRKQSWQRTSIWSSRSSGELQNCSSETPSWFAATRNWTTLRTLPHMI